MWDALQGPSTSCHTHFLNIRYTRELFLFKEGGEADANDPCEVSHSTSATTEEEREGSV